MKINGKTYEARLIGDLERLADYIREHNAGMRNLDDLPEGYPQPVPPSWLDELYLDNPEPVRTWLNNLRKSNPDASITELLASIAMRQEEQLQYLRQYESHEAELRAIQRYEQAKQKISATYGHQSARLWRTAATHLMEGLYRTWLLFQNLRRQADRLSGHRQ